MTDDPKARSVGGLGGLPLATALPVLAMMVAAVVIYLVWWGPAVQMGSDTAEYQGIARDLSDGSLAQLNDRTPGYPAVLLATGSSTTLSPALLAVQWAFHLGACWMALLLARRFGPPRWALLALAAALLSPPLVEKVFVAMSEATTEVLLCGAVLLLVRWRERSSPPDALAAGAVIGAAALVRPTYQLLGIVVAVAAAVCFARQHRWRAALVHGAALAVGSVVLVGGLVVMNAVRFDYVGVTPILGWNLGTRTALYIDDLPADEPARDVLIEARNRALVEGESHSGLMYFWSVRGQIEEATGLGRPAIDRYMLRLHLGLILRNPIDYAAAVGTASTNYVLPSYTDAATGGRRIWEVFFLVGHALVVAGFVVQLFGVVGLYVARRLRAVVDGPSADRGARRVWLYSLGVALYTAIISVSVEAGYPRYRTPTDPLILVVVFGGLWMCWSAFGRRQPPAEVDALRLAEDD